MTEYWSTRYRHPERYYRIDDRGDVNTVFYKYVPKEGLKGMGMVDHFDLSREDAERLRLDFEKALRSKSPSAPAISAKPQPGLLSRTINLCWRSIARRALF